MNNKMTMSEAGKLGAIASKVTNKKRQEDRIVKYNSNPVICKNCNNPLPYKDRRNKFCNKSCAAKTNNLGVCRNYSSINIDDKITIVRKSRLKNCIGCETETRNTKYCNIQCQNKYEWNCKKKEILLNGLNSSYGGTENLARLAKRILEEDNRECSICKLKEWMNKPIPLIIDHIDGDSSNYNWNNFRLVCGNCDMQLDTYKSKNKGKGRLSRKLRYHLDKERSI